VPEGDTVHRTAQRLDRALSGDRLVRTDFRVPQHATVDLSGATVVETVARGKHLLTRIDADESLTLHTHLKMEGSWRTYAPDEGWKRPAHQVRVVLATERSVAVGFALGVVELIPRDWESETVGHLGPDLLGPDWDEDEALSRLLVQPDRAIREALLDQHNLAGVGNMYAAELCFVSGVAPTTPVRDVPDLRRLVRRAKLMLEQNVQRATQSTTGDLREPFWVYRRDKRACRRCGNPIVVAMRGRPGRERAAYWCPHCQR
jgi:endonuclease VIII